MSRPSIRLLAFLELLESAPSVEGRAAAERLGVDARTIRRYVVALHDLGIEVEGQRGVGGGYRLRPGHRIPPLMLGDDEATAVVLGLIATQRLGLGASEGALAKLRRVLPAPLRLRVEALESVVAFTGAVSAAAPPEPATLLLVAAAVQRRRRMRVHYTPAATEGAIRELDPYGVVVHGGRWYVPARDARSGQMRTFRIDRMRDTVLGEAAAPAPAGFDAVEHVVRSLARFPWAWSVEVLVHAPLERIAARVPPTLAELEKTEGGTVLRMRVDSLDWAAQVLAGLGEPFEVREPDELRESLRALAALLHTAAQDGE